MAQNNLIPFPKSNRSKDEIREINSKGGKASGATRRKKRDMKQCMELLLSLPASSPYDYQLLADMGMNFADFSTDEINNMLIVNAALLREAKNGDVAAAKELRSIIRDDEKIKIEKERLKLEKEKQKREAEPSGVSSTELPRLYEALQEVDKE